MRQFKYVGQPGQGLRQGQIIRLSDDNPRCALFENDRDFKELIIT